MHVSGAFRPSHPRPRLGSDRRLQCVALEACPDAPIPEAPVALCGYHMRTVYQFAADFITENWDSAVREYVSDLHGTFKPPRAVKRPLPGWVYFIRFGDRVKVGYSTDPQRRLQELPHDEVLGIVPGTRADEAAWHDLLSHYRVTGEWFRADPEVLEVLARINQRPA